MQYAIHYTYVQYFYFKDFFQDFKQFSGCDNIEEMLNFYSRYFFLYIITLILSMCMQCACWRAGIFFIGSRLRLPLKKEWLPDSLLLDAVFRGFHQLWLRLPPNRFIGSGSLWFFLTAPAPSKNARLSNTVCMYRLNNYENYKRKNGRVLAKWASPQSFIWTRLNHVATILSNMNDW